MGTLEKYFEKFRIISLVLMIVMNHLMGSKKYHILTG